jgi:hypothetical protein
MSKRKFESNTNIKYYDDNFQLIIDFTGTDTVLTSFAKFLGRDEAKIHDRETDPNIRITRTVKVPMLFTGLAFDGAHWKGYEDGICKYNSYSANIQRSGTNNYCQSFACYLWSSKGLKNDLHNTILLPYQYAENISIISKLWLKWFEEVDQKFIENILEEFYPNIDTHLNKTKIIETLEKLVKDEYYAIEFASSKE